MVAGHPGLLASIPLSGLLQPVGNLRPKSTRFRRLPGWEDAFGNQLRSMPNAMRQVDAEHGDGSAADRGAADQDRPLPAEVAGPAVSARIEEMFIAGQGPRLERLSTC